ncbi:MAG: hypothetical protein ACNI27_07360 [Desulfovibrio sp.]
MGSSSLSSAKDWFGAVSAAAGAASAVSGLTGIGQEKVPNAPSFAPPPTAASTQKAVEDQRRRLLLRKGVGATNLTGGQAVNETVETPRLLGGLVGGGGNKSLGSR